MVAFLNYPLFASLLVLLAAASSCAPARLMRPGCGKDTDCKGSRICVAGACAEPVAKSTPTTAMPASAPAPGPVDTPPPNTPELLPPLPVVRAGSQFHGDARHTGRYAGHLPRSTPREVLRYATQGTVFGGIALAGDLAIFGSHDRGLYAVTYGSPTPPDADAGSSDPTLRWRRDLGDMVWATPAIGDGVVYAGSDDDQVAAFSLPTGEQRWRFQTGPCKNRKAVGPDGARCDVDGITVAGDGTLYVAADGLYALRPEGTLKWKYSPGPTHCAGNPAVGDDGTVYVGCQDHGLYAVGTDGTLRWTVRAGDDIDASPAIGPDGTIYVGSDDKKLWAISPSGLVRFSVITGGPIHSSAAIGADGTVYFGSFDGQLYAISPSGGAKWSYRAADRIASSPIVDADGAILFGSEDDRLYALEPDGRLRWSVQLDGDVDGTPTLGDDGTIFIGADDRALHVLK